MTEPSGHADRAATREEDCERGPPLAALVGGSVLTLAVDHQAFVRLVEAYGVGSTEAHGIAVLLSGLVWLCTHAVGNAMGRVVEARERGGLRLVASALEVAALLAALTALGLDGADAGKPHPGAAPEVASLLARAQVVAAVVSIWLGYRWQRGAELRGCRRRHRRFARSEAAVRRAEEREAVARRAVELARVRADPPDRALLAAPAPPAGRGGDDAAR